MIIFGKFWKKPLCLCTENESPNFYQIKLWCLNHTRTCKTLTSDIKFQSRCLIKNGENLTTVERSLLKMWINKYFCGSTGFIAKCTRGKTTWWLLEVFQHSKIKDLQIIPHNKALSHQKHLDHKGRDVICDWPLMWIILFGFLKTGGNLIK